jgi:hypothetical protein
MFKNTLGIESILKLAVITQAGTLEGIENIKPPIRLFFIPLYPLIEDFTAENF